MKRRGLLHAGMALAGGTALMATPPVQLLAQQAKDFVLGPPAPNMPLRQLGPRSWMVYTPDGFPTEANRGNMANVTFVVTNQGVVVLDSGASLQIGEMALRRLREVTDQPVVAVFNSHYHGDHWLGNHAMVKHFGADLPIYALAQTLERIKQDEGSRWQAMMLRWTNQSTLGTEVVPPNRVVQPGQRLSIGDHTFVMHHYGVAHTPADLCVQVVQEGITHVGDIAMGNRIANMDDGSYPGTFATYAKLQAAAGEQRWVPGHGAASGDLLANYQRFLQGIWQPCLQAVEQGRSMVQARAAVLADPRVAPHARTMQGFANNIGKYVSLAYLEAEKLAF